MGCVKNAIIHVCFATVLYKQIVCHVLLQPPRIESIIQPWQHMIALVLINILILKIIRYAPIVTCLVLNAQESKSTNAPHATL